MEEILAAHTDPGSLAAAMRVAMANPGKNAHPENWEVLADATDTRLKELGLVRGQVEKHSVLEAASVVGKHVLVRGVDRVGAVDTAQ
jgi:hypothetical protein